MKIHKELLHLMVTHHPISQQSKPNYNNNNNNVCVLDSHTLRNMCLRLFSHTYIHLHEFGIGAVHECIVDLLNNSDLLYNKIMFMF